MDLPHADNKPDMCVCVSTDLHEKDFNGQKVIYWEVKYPMPLSNRDVSLKHMSRSSNAVWRDNVFVI